MFGGWMYAGPLWCEFGFRCGAGVTLIAVGAPLSLWLIARCIRRIFR